MISDYSPKFRFNLTDAGKESKITLSTGAQSANDTEYVSIGYIETNQTNISSINKTKITVTPATSGAQPVSFTFTLADYYAVLKANEVSDDVLAAVDAMYGYAEADARY